MADKKFSEFEDKPLLDDNDFIPTETIGVGNNKTKYIEFKNQIANEVINETARLSAGRIVQIIAKNSGGNPVGFDSNLIYADGRQVQRSESNNVAKFIDYAEADTGLKAFYQIPNTKDYFIVPDLRNKHLVSAGSVNPLNTMIESRILNPQVAVATSVADNGNHAHPINNIQGAFDTQRKDSNFQDNITNPSGGFRTFNSNNTTGHYLSQVFVGGTPFERVEFSSHRAGVTATNNAGNHSHIATSTVSYTNPNIFDSVNRVPAFSVFAFIDIALSELFVNPNIPISSVVGLQDVLDGKVFTSVYSAYVTSNNLEVASKVEQLEYDNYVTSNNLTVGNKLNTSTFNSIFNGSWNSIRRAGLTQVIANSAIVGRNIITDLQNIATTNTGAVDFLDGTTLTTGYPTIANAVIPSNYRLPIITGKTSYRVVISIRATGVFANVGEFKDLFARLILANGTTIISGTSLRRSITDNGSPLVGVFEPIRVTSSADALVTSGFNIVLFNNNNPNSNYTLNTIELAFTYL